MIVNIFIENILMLFQTKQWKQIQAKRLNHHNLPQGQTLTGTTTAVGLSAIGQRESLSFVVPSTQPPFSSFCQSPAQRGLASP